MRRNETKEKELKFLAEEYRKNPLLFEKETLIDSPEFLSNFGIFVRGKENFPSGYLKLWPQDFIVEEIAKTEGRQTINFEKLLKEGRIFSGNDPTIYATLVKCNLSAFEAMEELSSFLGKNAQINFAGIKDKDAITAQLISFRKENIENIKKINSSYLFLKNVFPGKGVVEIGGLKGNEFTVLVRTDNDFKKEIFLDNLNRVKEEGIFNFFYLQRFGTPRLINFHWGLFILKGEYEKAVLSFLTSPGKRELPYFQQLRERIKKDFGNWQEIEKMLEPFPLIFQNEKKVVGYLKDNPTDFIGALSQIPEQIQLWLFALASLFFNKRMSSCLEKNEKLPEDLPLILSDDKRDWSEYRELLSKNGISESSLNNLKPFPFIQWRKRIIKTKEKVEVLDCRVIQEGVILNFVLPKACYATTFLAHLFNLTSGLPPKNISDYPIDTKASLGKESLEEVLNRFQEIIHPKTEDFIKKFSLETS